ncbi:MAG TPA: DUF3817 domain-containing protein [Pseudonocardiaceae bacterium]|jgi:integral membrane protein|nr:DUF3817 domain-containing protein [Pseudonocardiaceae bacterium]
MPADTATTPVDAIDAKIRAALGRYRVMAYTVGVGLLLLCVATALDWGFHQPRMAEIVGPLHGFLYMIYLAMAVDLALKARWSWKGAIMVLLAGVVPFLSFVAEHQVTKRVNTGKPL